MFHILKVPDECNILWQKCQSLVPDLLKNIPIKSSDLIISPDKPINPKSRSIYLIKSGLISETYEGQVIVNHDEGDLICADTPLHEKTYQFENDYEVIVDEYDGQQFFDEIFDNKIKFQIWNQYCSYLSQSYKLILCYFSKQEQVFKPEFRYYNEGDILIEENTEGNEVFTLLAGSAKVMINNTEIGEINTDEIFGAIAALTNTKRNASVIAISDCETLVVKSERFRSLLAARPDTVQKLITDMARTIASCNDKIITLSKSKI